MEANINKKPIKEQVVAYLRKQIMLGELKAGEHLKEYELSKNLNVSRGPVREAITVLEDEGLVKTRSNGRTIVIGFTVNDVTNLYEARILLETYALTKINHQSLEKYEKQLYRYIDEMQRYYDLGVRDVDSDLNFHRLIVEMSENKILIQLWQSIVGLISTLIDVTSEYVAFRQDKIINIHKDIADAIINKHFDKANILLRKHLEDAVQVYREAVEKINSKRNEG